jgi:hypothetical protein
MQFWLLLQPLHTACNKVYNKKGAIKFSHSSTVLVVVSYYCWNNRNIEPAFVRRVDPPVTPHQYCCPLPTKQQQFMMFLFHILFVWLTEIEPSCTCGRSWSTSDTPILLGDSLYMQKFKRRAQQILTRFDWQKYRYLCPHGTGMDQPMRYTNIVTLY